MAEILPAVPIAVVPPGTDLPCLPDVRPDTEYRTALFLSRIIPAKGLLTLINAWSIIKPPGWRLMVAGFDEKGHERKCRDAARDLGVDDVVTFAGPAVGEDKWRRFLEADLFILPSLSENFGIAIAEALASGLPVITTRGAPWEELEKRRCGWWVDLGVGPLVEAMREAFSLSRRELREMGMRGRALVEEKFTWEICARKMVEIYEWAMDSGPMPETVIVPRADRTVAEAGPAPQAAKQQRRLQNG